MAQAPRDGTTVIVLAEDFSCARAFVWDTERDCWMQFSGEWFDYEDLKLYTYDDDLDGYGWVLAPDAIYKKALP